MAITDGQMRAIKAAGDAANSCRLRARECDVLRLGTLAREYDYFARSLTEKIAMQIKALEGGADEQGKV